MQATGPQKQVRVGVGVFVFKPRLVVGQDQDDVDADPYKRFIFGERIGSHGGGTLALPGGHVEFGETFELCAAREVLEETGLRLERVAFLTAVDSLFRGPGGGDDALTEGDGEGEGQGQVEKHYVTIFMTAVAVAENMDGGGDGVVEPVNMEKDKCKGWVWGTLDDMIEMGEKEGLELFLPMKSLVALRSEACEWLRGL